MSKLVSIRLEDDALRMVEMMDGKNFTEKFHNLIRWHRDIYEKLQIEYIREKSALDSLRSEYKKLSGTFSRLKSLARSAEMLIDDYSDLNK